MQSGRFLWVTLTLRGPSRAMEAFFDPAIDALIQLVKDQSSQLKRSCGAKIDVRAPCEMDRCCAC